MSLFTGHIWLPFANRGEWRNSNPYEAAGAETEWRHPVCSMKRVRLPVRARRGSHSQPP